MPESGKGRNDRPQDADRQVPARVESEDRSNAAGNTPAREIGGPQGPEPTRYGDWERNGRCTDF
ncbi:MAG: DUF1674 domain-containing protein [Gammaproteobacteria bacterium]|nr:MAG: DUF1674 domain-containing protein [Gammaproteobacteria bacterium]